MLTRLSPSEIAVTFFGLGVIAGVLFAALV